MLRTRLRSEGVSLNFLVVASTEKPKEKLDGILGSYMPVTFTAGVVAADYVLKQLTK
jgi:tRNA A37 threonylcarbamoyladenosine dehydratase